MGDIVFENNSLQVIQALNAACGNWLEEVSGAIESQVKRNTTVDTGQLKGSWTHRVEKSTQRATIGSPLETAIWNEFGTGHYALEHDGRQTPWYVPVEGYIGSKKPTFNGKVVVVYGKNGKKFYKTNGKRPQRSLHNAFESRKSKIQKILKEKVKEAMT